MAEKFRRVNSGKSKIWNHVSISTEPRLEKRVNNVWFGLILSVIIDTRTTYKIENDARLEKIKLEEFCAKS